MANITNELLQELMNIKDIEEFFKKNENSFIGETPQSFLNALMTAKNMTIAQVVKISGSGEYVYKVMNGTRKPSRNILISIAFGMKMSLDEVQLLLRISKQARLDSRDKRDSIIIYGFVNALSIYETDDLLNENGFVTIRKNN